MTYGYEVHQRDDEMLEAAKTMSSFGAPRVLPGALLVNDLPLRVCSLLTLCIKYLPLLPIPTVRHIPEWLAWFSYKPLARVGNELGKQVLYPPIQFVKESIVGSSFFRCKNTQIFWKIC